MPTTNRRVMITLSDPSLLRTLGYDPETVGAAEITDVISSYASLVQYVGRKLERLLSREDWCFLADALNGCYEALSPTHGLSPLVVILAQIEDAQRLDGLADKWYGDGRGDAAAARLRETLASMTTVAACAVFAAVRHFWSHPDLGVDSEWWKVAARANPDSAVDHK